MENNKRLVTQIPLENIWTDEGETFNKRKRYLIKNEIQEIF